MALDNYIDTLEKVCSNYVTDNNDSFCSHLISEITTFKNDIDRYDKTPVIQTILNEEMKRIGYDQSLDNTSIVTDLDVVDVLFRTKKNDDHLVLLGQDSTHWRAFLKQTKKMRRYLYSANKLLKRYHSAHYVNNNHVTANRRGSGNHIVIGPSINIVWMGKVSWENQIVLKDFIDNILDVFQGAIHIHLVDGLADDYVDLPYLSSHNELVKIIPNNDEIKNNITIADLCVTTQDRALLPSILGIITIIRPDYQSHCRDDRYIYSYELDRINHVVDYNSLSNDGLQIVGIRDVVFDIHCCKNNALISDSCKKYAQNTLSLGLNLVKSEGIERSIITSNEEISKELNLYLSYQEKTNKSYREFRADNNVTSEGKNTDKSDDWKKEQIYTKRDNYSLNELIGLQNRYNKTIELIKRKKTKITVAFLVLFKQTFSSAPLFKAMIEDGEFDPYIVVIPNVSRSLVYQNDLYKDTYASMRDKYGSRVVHGYIERLNKYVELKDDYDIVVFNNPYEGYEHPFHNIKYFENRNVLPIYVNYGYLITRYSDVMLKENIFNSVWKYLLETEYHLDYYRGKSITGGINGMLTGFVKMDALYHEKRLNKKRKTIIIAPHHTVTDNPEISLSNFIKYSEFFLNLPSRYPKINFVFRPHPLLFAHLKFNKIWNEVEIENYLKRIESIPNMIYDDSDYYFDKFTNSDAIIHDCGSFIAEYLYTNKPCCYMIKNNEQLRSTLLPFAQKCLDCYYKAFSEKDIVNFIEDVVINGIDPLEEKRTAYSHNKLMINYPHVSEKFINYLKSELRP